MVYVLNINGQSLMSTNRHGKVKHLLKDGRAKVVKRCPFTIQLLYSSTNYTQELTLGVDTGSGTIGTAVSTDNGDIVYMSEVVVRNDISDKMTQRARYRRARRSRKTRYRKARWLNRANSIRQNRFSSTMVSKFHSHVIYHIVYRSNGGSNDESNLITLCHTCHKDLHSGKIKPRLSGKAKGTLRYATQMNSIRKQLFRTYPCAIETFGYVTKANRLQLGMDKQHYYDACVVATEGKPFTVKCSLYKKKCISEGDFQKTKGIRSEQPITTAKICGFRKFDKVKYFGKEYFIKGRMSSGYAILMDIDGNKIDFSDMPKGLKTPKLGNCKRLTARTSQMVLAVAV